MGIRFSCPNGHPLHVKEHLAGKRGICPSCGAKFVIPAANDSPEARSVPLPAGASVSTVAGAASQAEKPSVVIPLAEEPPAAPISSSPAQQAEVFRPPTDRGIPVVEAALPAGPHSVVVTETEQPIAPAIKYVAHRERIRRNRTRVAILLLVAVIVLAAVLIWMLVAGPVALGSNVISSAMHSSIYFAWGVPRFHFESPIRGGRR
jgi:hypothetical protein